MTTDAPERMDDLSQEALRQNSDCGAVHSTRDFVRRMITHPLFEVALNLSVLAGMILVIVNIEITSDNDDPAFDEPKWLKAAQIALILVYLLELCAKVYVYRRRFFHDRFRVLDFVTITIDAGVTVADSISGTAFPVGLARMARVLKVTRMLRAMTAFPEVKLLIKGSLLAARSLIWGVLMLFMFLSIWSVFAVVLIHPLMKDLEGNDAWDGCERCPRAYKSWTSSMLTLTMTLIGGGDFGQLNIPIIEMYPATSIFFGLVLVLTMLLVLNLLMALAVERALEASKMNIREEAELKQRDFEKARVYLTEMVEAMDADDDGFVSWKEFEASFKNNKDFEAHLRAMDINETDLKPLFSMMDIDDDGLISHNEFSEKFYAMRHKDSRTMLAFLGCHVEDIQKKLGHILMDGGAAHRRKLTRALTSRRSKSDNFGLQHPHVLQGAERLMWAIRQLDDMRRELVEVATQVNLRSGSFPPAKHRDKLAEVANDVDTYRGYFPPAAQQRELAEVTPNLGLHMGHVPRSELAEMAADADSHKDPVLHAKQLHELAELAADIELHRACLAPAKQPCELGGVCPPSTWRTVRICVP